MNKKINLKTTVKHEDKFYLVSTIHAEDEEKPETAIFLTDEDGEIGELPPVKVYEHDSDKEAAEDHYKIAENISDYITESEEEASEKTVTITAKQLSEAMAEAWGEIVKDNESAEERVKMMLMSLTVGAAINAKVHKKLFHGGEN